MTKENILKAVKFTACNLYQDSRKLRVMGEIRAADALKDACEELCLLLRNEKYCKHLAEMWDKLNSPDRQEDH